MTLPNERPEHAAARIEAQRYIRALLEELDKDEEARELTGDGSYTYDTVHAMAVGYMLAGGGPTVYAWFIIHGTEVREALLEHSTDDGRSVWEVIPEHRANELFFALNDDAAAREARR